MTRTTAISGKSAGWPTTLWDLIRSARDGRGEDKRTALEALLRLYYKPVHRFFKRALKAGEDRTDDVSQDFFTRLIEKDFLKNITHEHSFRAFLKTACRRHFITWLESRGARPVPRIPAEEDLEPLIDEEFRAWYLDEALKATAAELSDKPVCLAVFEARIRFDDAKPEDYQALADRFNLRVYDIRNLLTAARKVFRRALMKLAEERTEDPRLELSQLGFLKYL